MGIYKYIQTQTLVYIFHIYGVTAEVYVTHSSSVGIYCVIFCTLACVLETVSSDNVIVCMHVSSPSYSG